MLFKKALIASVASSVAAAPTAGGCNDYVLISARGTGEIQGHSSGFVGMIHDTLEAVPGGVEYDVRYPAISDPTQKTTFIGARDVEDYINNGYKNCPQQKYALLGYSQGATVVLEAIQKLSGTKAGKQIKSTVLIGNPYQVRNDPTTVDQNGGDVTRPYDGILRPLEGTLNLKPRLTHDGSALNICLIGDPVCTGAAFAITSPIHLSYGFNPKAQKLGAEHLIANLS